MNLPFVTQNRAFASEKTTKMENREFRRPVLDFGTSRVTSALADSQREAERKVTWGLCQLVHFGAGDSN